MTSKLSLKMFMVCLHSYDSQSGHEWLSVNRNCEPAESGGGNMAEAIVRGLLAGSLPGERIQVAEPLAARRMRLARRYGVSTTADNAAAAACDVLVLAVKPQIMDDVLAGLSGSVAPKTSPAKRPLTKAPAHIAHGSRVTTISQPSNRQPSTRSRAFRYNSPPKGARRSARE